jgi:Phage integrase, N-terminal SAM-like domain
VVSKLCTPDNRDGPAVPERRRSGALAGTGAGDERETTAVPGHCGRRPGRLDAGPFAADVASFRLHLAAENKAPGTIRIYTGAPLWFAAAYLLGETGETRWERVDAQDVQRWVAWLLGGYSEAYARQQYRALRQFFLWLAAEDQIPDPTARLRAPAVRDKPVPFSPA